MKKARKQYHKLALILAKRYFLKILLRLNAAQRSSYRIHETNVCGGARAAHLLAALMGG
jgi:hypothetical protein